MDAATVGTEPSTDGGAQTEGDSDADVDATDAAAVARRERKQMWKYRVDDKEAIDLDKYLRPGDQPADLIEVDTYMGVKYPRAKTMGTIDSPENEMDHHSARWNDWLHEKVAQLQQSNTDCQCNVLEKGDVTEKCVLMCLTNENLQEHLQAMFEFELLAGQEKPPEPFLNRDSPREVGQRNIDHDCSFIHGTSQHFKVIPNEYPSKWDFHGQPVCHAGMLCLLGSRYARVECDYLQNLDLTLSKAAEIELRNIALRDLLDYYDFTSLDYPLSEIEVDHFVDAAVYGTLGNGYWERTSKADIAKIFAQVYLFLTMHKNLYWTRTRVHRGIFAYGGHVQAYDEPGMYSETECSCDMRSFPMDKEKFRPLQEILVTLPFDYTHRYGSHSMFEGVRVHQSALPNGLWCMLDGRGMLLDVPGRPPGQVYTDKRQANACNELTRFLLEELHRAQVLHSDDKFVTFDVGVFSTVYTVKGVFHEKADARLEPFQKGKPYKIRRMECPCPEYAKPLHLERVMTVPRAHLPFPPECFPVSDKSVVLVFPAEDRVVFLQFIGNDTTGLNGPILLIQPGSCAIIPAELAVMHGFMNSLSGARFVKVLCTISKTDLVVTSVFPQKARNRFDWPWTMYETEEPENIDGDEQKYSLLLRRKRGNDADWPYEFKKNGALDDLIELFLY